MPFALLTAALLMALPAPRGATLHGTVRMAGSLEPVSHAMVRISAIDRSTTTDQRGYFAMADLPEGRHTVLVQALGVERHETVVHVPSGGYVRLDIRVDLRPVAIEGVGVRGSPAGGYSEAGPGPDRITGAVIRATPALVEADVMRAVQALPSVSAASDFSSALYVRGGSPDQTAVTVDGVPMFNPYHLGGIFGALDPDIVAGVDVWPGAMPASGEDRISGAVAIRTREGGRDRMRGQGGIGLISSRASLDGPLPGGEGSYLVSLRRTYLDLFTDLAYRAGWTDVTLPYAFTDLYLKVAQDIGRSGSLTVSSYLGSERFVFPERMQEEFGSRMDFGWGTRLISARYRHLIVPALVGEVQVATTALRGDFDAAERSRFMPVPVDRAEEDEHFRPVFDSRSRVRDRIASARLTWHGARHRARTGLRIDGLRFDHRLTHAQPDAPAPIPGFDLSQRVITAAVYLEDEWSPSESWSVRGGLRLLHAGALGTALMPRIGARWNVTSDVALSIGAGRYAQVVQSLRDEEAPGASVLAYDFPAAVEPETGLSEAADLVAGVEWSRGSTAVRLDAYEKRLSSIPLPPRPGADILETPMLVPEGFRRAAGTARGIELLARHVWPDAEINVAYALAHAERRVDGSRFPPRFERRHTLDVQGTAPGGWWGRWSFRYQLASGQPYTPILGIPGCRPTIRRTASSGTGGTGGSWSGSTTAGAFRDTAAWTREAGGRCAAAGSAARSR